MNHLNALKTTEIGRPRVAPPRRSRCPQVTLPRLVLVDDLMPQVRRITLNRTRKRNALLDALHAADSDGAVRVTILRGRAPARNETNRSAISAAGNADTPNK